MLRFSKSITTSMLTALAVFILLAWPLHQALHAAESINGAAVAVWSFDDDGSADGDPHGPNGNKVKTCDLCLFHGAHLLAGGAPESLRLHAEASQPPAALPQGLPTGRCSLAAAPRGPPSGWQQPRCS